MKNKVKKTGILGEMTTNKKRLVAGAALLGFGIFASQKKNAAKSIPVFQGLPPASPVLLANAPAIVLNQNTFIVGKGMAMVTIPANCVRVRIQAIYPNGGSLTEFTSILCRKKMLDAINAISSGGNPWQSTPISIGWTLKKEKLGDTLYNLYLSNGGIQNNSMKWLSIAQNNTSEKNVIYRKSVDTTINGGTASDYKSCSQTIEVDTDANDTIFISTESNVQWSVEFVAGNRRATQSTIFYQNTPAAEMISIGGNMPNAIGANVFQFNLDANTRKTGAASGNCLKFNQKASVSTPVVTDVEIQRLMANEDNESPYELEPSNYYASIPITNPTAGIKYLGSGHAIIEIVEYV